MYVEREMIILFSVVLALAVGFLVYNLYRMAVAEQHYQLKEEEANRLLSSAEEKAKNILRSALENAKSKSAGILDAAREQAGKETEEAMEKANADAERMLLELEQETKINREKLQKETQTIGMGIKANREALLAMQEELKVFSGTTTVLASGITDVSVLSVLSDEEKKERWKELRQKEQEMIRNGVAVIVSIPTSGKLFMGKDSKRILRNFNSDCDCYMAFVNTVGVKETQQKIMQSFDVLNELYADSGVAIHKDFLRLKLEEVALSVYQNETNVV